MADEKEQVQTKAAIEDQKNLDAEFHLPTYSPPWTELPRDVIANILQRLGSMELLETAKSVCTTWRSVCKDPAMWRVIDLTDVLTFEYDGGDVCRHAVDLSQGQLVDINIEYFGSDGLLHYISERSSELRRLRIQWCHDISGVGLNEAVKKLTQLEELNLCFMHPISAEDVEAIGLSCPTLKSFTFNDCKSIFPMSEENEYAMAVAKSMPALRHLGLLGNMMTNEGLQAILDSCPHLESLDIRKCFRVDLQGDLGRRCVEQLKDLKRPGDYTSDREWKNGEGASDLDGEYDLSKISNGYEYDLSEFSDGYPFFDYEDDSFGYYEDYTDPFNYGYLVDDDDDQLGFFY